MRNATSLRTVRASAIASLAALCARSAFSSTCPAREIAVSAFHSAVRARRCATDSEGDTARHGRGDTDRGRVSRILRTNAVLGVLGTTCTGGVGIAFVRTV